MGGGPPLTPGLLRLYQILLGVSQCYPFSSTASAKALEAEKEEGLRKEGAFGGRHRPRGCREGGVAKALGEHNCHTVPLSAAELPSDTWAEGALLKGPPEG